MILQDEHGDRIQASICSSVLKQLKSAIKERGLYVMKNFIVCKNAAKIRATTHKLKLNFKLRTIVTEKTDPSFSMKFFSFRSYSHLIHKVSVNELELFDVIGEIISFGQIQTHNVGGSSRKFINIELEDAELSSIFWGEFVEQIIPQLLRSDNQPVVVFLQLIQAKFQDSYTVRNA
ncbi:hypothetical protein P3L10_029386 [Capsicum annuum]